MGAAAADMPLEPLADNGRRRAWVLARQRHRTQDHTRPAEAALKCGAIEKRLLCGVRAARCSVRSACHLPVPESFVCHPPIRLRVAVLSEWTDARAALPN